ncbi:MAG TPA: sugar kinase [Chloroflexota bacterium]|jgi:2-dehydro-3-deoxygluconokinase
MPDLLALGECMIELFSDEPLAAAPAFVKTFGGDTCNVLVAAARLGTSTGFITRVGDDPFGPFLRQAWQAEGIDVRQARLVDGFNGLYLISLLPGGEREFVYYRTGSAASTLQPSDLNEQSIAAAKVLHVSGISQAISPSSRATVLAAAQMARRNGVRVAFDPNLRLRLWSLEAAQAALAELLPYIDIALPSAPEESEVLIGEREPDRIAAYFLEAGVSLVAVKCGAEGVLVAQGSGRTAVAAHVPDQVRDTSGAGDVFGGAFLHGLIAGMTPVRAARLGVVAAGLKLRGRGAIASQARREEILQYIEADDA